ncbi:MAG: hypothetical protein FWG81_09245 [Betaproteobacteria bacterium]|nr:hypothetical protein [Betaproteobacteria bacterium]
MKTIFLSDKARRVVGLLGLCGLFLSGCASHYDHSRNYGYRSEREVRVVRQEVLVAQRVEPGRAPPPRYTPPPAPRRETPIRQPQTGRR